jgi:hypothetical protein
MTVTEIRQEIAKATELVKSWPEWKQNILVHSSQPSISTPRPPVSNQPSTGGKQETTCPKE